MLVRSRVLVIMGVFAGLGVFGCAPAAFAAAPEAPETTAAGAVTASGATLNGVLNPFVKGPTPGYFFTFNTNGTCTEGSSTEAVAEAPEVEVQAFGVSAPVAGLEPSREYTFCLVATHLEGETLETSSGAPEHFTTLPEAPRVDGESVSGVTAFGATLEAQVNPNNQETNVSFQYSTQASGETLEGEVTTVPGGVLGAEFGDRAVSAATGVVLQAGVTYFYRAIAENGASERTEGTVQAFTTPGAPVVTGTQASSVTRTSALIAGEVDAHGARTEYFLEYGRSEAHGAPGSPTRVAVLGAEPAGPQPIAAVVLEELTPGTTYHYRIVAVNEAGRTPGTEGTFTTAAPQPPSAMTGEASEISQSGAAITGTVNANGLPTTYTFEVGSEVVGGVPVYSTPAYGEAGSEAVSTGVRLALSSLLPGTTYHYRVTATNADGTSHGADRTFTTPGYPSPIAEPGHFALLALTVFPNTSAGGATPKSKPLTRGQKLARALRACHAKHGKKRHGCEAAARRKYGSTKRKR
jgi:hypothetical protein